MVPSDPAASREFRRPYVVILALLLMLLLLVRFTYLRAPGTDVAVSLAATAAEVVDALIGASLAALGVTFLLFVVFPAKTPDEEIKVLPARKISDFIRSETSDTREWLIRARTAGFFRARTMKWLSEAASARSRAIDVRLVLMDPRDHALARLHLESRSKSAIEWTERRITLEICAAVLACIQESRANPRLRFSVSLVRTLWLTSLDISTGHAVVAGPQYGHPAIAYGNESEFFDSLRGEFDAAFANGEELRLAAVEESNFDHADAVRTALEALGLSSVLSAQEDIAAIQSMIQFPERSNEYR